MTDRRLATLLTTLSLALVTAAGATVAVPAAASAAAADPSVGGALSIRPDQPIEYELTRFTGTLVTAVRRPVQLQVATKKGAFKTVSLSSTSTSGRYRFKEIVQPRSGITRVRVLAPAKRVGPTTYPAIRTRAVRTRILPQYAVLNADQATVGLPFAVVATVIPVREGRPVEVQRLDGSTWVTVASGTENASGFLATTLTELTPGPRTYRVFSASRKGAKSVISAPVVVEVAPAS